MVAAYKALGILQPGMCEEFLPAGRYHGILVETASTSYPQLVAYFGLLQSVAVGVGSGGRHIHAHTHTHTYTHTM